MSWVDVLGQTPFMAVGWVPDTVEQLQPKLPQYEIIEMLGRGGMGAVYKARQRSLNRLVAIKVLPRTAPGGDLNFAERFKIEAHAMAKLNHPAIVAVHDIGETDDGQLYFVMELVEGTDLAKRIESEGRLPVEEVREIALRVCDALEYAHSHGVVHRDIKPSNILLSGEGRVKVADFGLAKIEGTGPTGPLTLSSTTMGSQDFAAPEMLSKARAVDHRADIYSFGVLLYQMLTGDVPRGMFKMPSEKVPGLDSRFDAIVCQAMEELREERYQSVGELWSALDATRSSVSESREAASDTEGQHAVSSAAKDPVPAPQPTRSRRVLAGVAVVAVIAGIAWQGFATLWPGSASRDSDEPLPEIAAFSSPSDEGGIGQRDVPAVAGAASDPEVRQFVSWLSSLPLPAEPSRADGKMPDVMVEGTKRNLRKVDELPAGPFSISRVRFGPLRVNETVHEQLGVLSRMPRITDLRFSGVDDANALWYARNHFRLSSLIFEAAAPGPLPMPDETMASLARASLLTTLRFEGWGVLTGKGFSRIEEKRRLTTIVLSKCPDLSDEGLTEIARFTNLKSLILTCGPKVTDAGLAQLAALHELEELTLTFEAGTSVTGSGFAALAVLKKLRSLTLEGPFPGSGLQHVGLLASLEEFECMHNSSVNDTAIAGLSGLSNLRTLRLGDTDLTGRGFASFKSFNNPLRLSIEGCRVTNEGLRAVAAAFPQLSSLVLSRHPASSYTLPVMVDELSRLKALTHLHCGYGFKDEDLIEVAKLTGLRELTLKYSKVTDAGLVNLKPLENLTRLEVGSASVTDGCVPALGEMRGLKSLEITSSRMTEKGAAALRTLLPECKITK